MSRLPVARVRRRPVLFAGMTVLGGVAAVPALSGLLLGCAERPPDPLVALLAQARADAALAAAAAETLRSKPDPASPGTPDPDRPGPPGAGSDAGKAEVVAALAAARRAHADALTTELGDDAPPPGAEQPTPGGGLSAVTAALDDAQRRAADAVPGLPRHRAALVGSIAACCGAYRAVLS